MTVQSSRLGRVAAASVVVVALAGGLAGGLAGCKGMVAANAPVGTAPSIASAAPAAVSTVASSAAVPASGSAAEAASAAPSATGSEASAASGSAAGSASGSGTGASGSGAAGSGASGSGASGSGAGAVSVSVTAPVSVLGSVAVPVSCVAGLAYRARVSSAVVRGDQVSFSVAILRYRGPGSYPAAVVGATLRQASGTVTAVAGVSRVPAVISGSGGSFSVSATGSGGRTFTGKLNWTCGS